MNKIRLGIFLSAMMAITACKAPFMPFIPSPVWSAVVKPVPIPLGTTQDAKTEATNRARAYISSYLPLYGTDLKQKLERLGFECKYQELKCHYSESGPAGICSSPIRVDVEVDFPTYLKTLSINDLNIAAEAVEDRENKDARGCFPL